MRIIPAIDIINGRCVRLTKGDYNTVKEYNSDPLEVAKQFENHGISYLHLVDLDGAKAKKIVNYKVLEKIASQTKLHIDFGGGVQSEEDVRIAFESGAKQLTGGSIAVKKPEIFKVWLQTFGAEKIILGADAMDNKIAVHGWHEDSGLDLIPFLQGYQKEGVKYVISTDVAKDGMLEGPSLGMYQDILTHCPDLFLIASGGVSKVDDLHQLKEAGLKGVIIGKAIYENRISLPELEKFFL
ncbi:1-(5-phosphoribosyl)-5-[(5-phosphoribosylamino)methylideneamino]imidazole-4-carboxamide isomerase [Cytophagales bacterium LB-30]|uniref:1-(5-phosphoribosyl)-5-[(5-phosphoribosylamino)methylideneamino] imidazole-4-carboxamide isomerase n=1 Tax=Shiella aurantiaca TaxID=3058365 RepID=A0ABT8F7L5_9BACT|nr:1-(5-phosphoribosyl)-5-[(5-phosphoribosylamino)methylideneamino]imidazole-4-carboxamide isomerase [Shiella aurantiaca]MDN4166450.1 1-(5-phosphoribosyl)-5-[(5-phosphoribosylamino)methylideneamino]imidazole-4-carboxamide isomerase [Shiella aurantiaca]